MIPKTSTPIILASTSEARSFLLQRTGLIFQAIPPDFDEERAKKILLKLSPAEMSLELAREKANSLKGKHPNALIIGSDQVCSLNGEIFSKPTDKKEAKHQFLRLSGKCHRVDTALFILGPNTSFEVIVPVYVTFHILLEEEIERALEPWIPGDPLYRIEGKDILLIKEIEGDLFSLMGLPLVPLLNFLKKAEIMKDERCGF